MSELNQPMYDHRPMTPQEMFETWPTYFREELAAPASGPHETTIIVATHDPDLVDTLASVKTTPPPIARAPLLPEQYKERGRHALNRTARHAAVGSLAIGAGIALAFITQEHVPDEARAQPPRSATPNSSASKEPGQKSTKPPQYIVQPAGATPTYKAPLQEPIIPRATQSPEEIPTFTSGTPTEANPTTGPTSAATAQGTTPPPKTVAPKPPETSQEPLPSATSDPEQSPSPSVEPTPTPSTQPSESIKPSSEPQPDQTSQQASQSAAPGTPSTQSNKPPTGRTSTTATQPSSN